jgi:hypothetical protein
MARRIQGDIEVDPFVLRRDLEFFVPLDVAKIGADERLRDVPFPKFVLCV